MPFCHRPQSYPFQRHFDVTTKGLEKAARRYTKGGRAPTADIQCSLNSKPFLSMRALTPAPPYNVQHCSKPWCAMQCQPLYQTLYQTVQNLKSDLPTCCFFFFYDTPWFVRCTTPLNATVCVDVWSSVWAAVAYTTLTILALIFDVFLLKNKYHKVGEGRNALLPRDLSLKHWNILFPFSVFIVCDFVTNTSNATYDQL